LEDFELTDDDSYAIGIAIGAARRLLVQPGITPQQIVGLGHAIYALERLPLATPGARSEFGICYSKGSESFSEKRYINFLVSEDTFEISLGGSVYDGAVGGDSFSEPGWLVESSGYRNTECELYSVEGSVEEYLNLGGVIEVSCSESDLTDTGRSD
jgi:hypothetical protein